MIGAIAGDIIGSPYEWNNTEDFSFKLFESNIQRRYRNERTYHPHMTDESIMTLAVARWMLSDENRNISNLSRFLISMCSSNMECGLSPAMLRWVNNDGIYPMRDDGNAAAAMISPVAMTSPTLKEAISTSRSIGQMLYSNEASVKGAEAMCEAIWLVKNGRSKEDVKFAMENGYGYDLSLPIENMKALARGAEKEEMIVNGTGTGEYFYRETGKRAFDAETTVTAAVRAYLDGSGFEDTVRRAVVIGGDSDTIASMAGALAGARYGVPEEIRRGCERFMPENDRSLVRLFETIGIRDNFKKPEPTKRQDDSFKIIRHGETRRIFVASPKRKDLIDALKQKFGQDIEIIRPSQMKDTLLKLSVQEHQGTYLENPRPDVRTVYFQDGQFRTSATAEGISSASKEERMQARKAFYDLSDYARQVKEKLQQSVGYYGDGSIHFDNAYFPEIFHDRVEIWKGDLFAGSVGIDPNTGLLKMSQGGDFGPMEWFDKTTDSVFMYEGMDFKEAIGRFCLDEGISERDPGRQLNIEVANNDVAHSQDNRLLKAVEQKIDKPVCIKM